MAAFMDLFSVKCVPDSLWAHMFEMDRTVMISHFYSCEIVQMPFAICITLCSVQRNASG